MKCFRKGSYRYYSVHFFYGCVRKREALARVEAAQTKFIFWGEVYLDQIWTTETQLTTIAGN
jgi:hypothetical protein